MPSPSRLATVISLLLLSIAPALCIGASLNRDSLLDLESRKALFLSATSFAVVGASDDEAKFGTIVFQTMLESGLSVVPINPFVPSSRGIPTLSSLSSLTDPKSTAISVVTQPAVTLQIVHHAHELGIFAVWLQPGAEDAAVLEFIVSVNASKTIYIHSNREVGLARRVDGPCVASDPARPDIISTLLRLRSG